MSEALNTTTAEQTAVPSPNQLALYDLVQNPDTTSRLVGEGNNAHLVHEGPAMIPVPAAELVDPKPRYEPSDAHAKTRIVWGESGKPGDVIMIPAKGTDQLRALSDKGHPLHIAKPLTGRQIKALSPVARQVHDATFGLNVEQARDAVDKATGTAVVPTTIAPNIGSSENTKGLENTADSTVTVPGSVKNERPPLEPFDTEQARILKGFDPAKRQAVLLEVATTAARTRDERAFDRLADLWGVNQQTRVELLVQGDKAAAAGSQSEPSPVIRPDQVASQPEEVPAASNNVPETAEERRQSLRDTASEYLAVNRELQAAQASGDPIRIAAVDNARRGVHERLMNAVTGKPEWEQAFNDAFAATAQNAQPLVQPAEQNTVHGSEEVPNPMTDEQFFDEVRKGIAMYDADYPGFASNRARVMQLLQTERGMSADEAEGAYKNMSNRIMGEGQPVPPAPVNGPESSTQPKIPSEAELWQFAENAHNTTGGKVDRANNSYIQLIDGLVATGMAEDAAEQTAMMMYGTVDAEVRKAKATGIAPTPESEPQQPKPKYESVYDSFTVEQQELAAEAFWSSVDGDSKASAEAHNQLMISLTDEGLSPQEAFARAQSLYGEMQADRGLYLLAEQVYDAEQVGNSEESDSLYEQLLDALIARGMTEEEALVTAASMFRGIQAVRQEAGAAPDDDDPSGPPPPPTPPGGSGQPSGSTSRKFRRTRAWWKRDTEKNKDLREIAEQREALGYDANGDPLQYVPGLEFDEKGRTEMEALQAHEREMNRQLLAINPLKALISDKSAWQNWKHINNQARGARQRMRDMNMAEVVPLPTTRGTFLGLPRWIPGIHDRPTYYEQEVHSVARKANDISIHSDVNPMTQESIRSTLAALGDPNMKDVGEIYGGIEDPSRPVRFWKPFRGTLPGYVPTLRDLSRRAQAEIRAAEQRRLAEQQAHREGESLPSNRAA